MSGATLIYMANHIARNLAARGEAEAIALTAKHISDFWEPRMRDNILAGDRSALSPIAAAAIDRLTKGSTP